MMEWINSLFSTQNLGQFTDIYFFLAFVGGFLGFFSPCTLPVLPLFLCYISGVSFNNLKTQTKSQRKVFLHALFFICGLIIVYSMLGAIVGFLGAKIFVKVKNIFLRSSGLILISFGIAGLSGYQIPFLSKERRLHFSFQKFNYLTSFVQGITFSLLWSPCTGPLLLGVLFMAESVGSLEKSTLIMFFFTLGISIPLLITGMLTSKVSALIKNKGQYLKYINYISGFFLIFLGSLLLFKKFYLFNSLISQMTNVKIE